jgi:hypothetical protein
MHQRTIVLLFAELAVLIFANSVPKTIPFKEGNESNMVKRGWPCSFHETTRHNRIWEWPDFAVDVAVAIGCLTLSGFASEWLIRNERRRDSRLRAWQPGYLTFVLVLAECGALFAVNLAERGVRIEEEDEVVRGWPVMALMVDKDSFFHTLILYRGVLIDVAAALSILIGTWLLAHLTWDAQNKTV